MEDSNLAIHPFSSRPDYSTKSNVKDVAYILFSYEYLNKEFMNLFFPLPNTPVTSIRPIL